MRFPSRPEQRRTLWSSFVPLRQRHRSVPSELKNNDIFLWLSPSSKVKFLSTSTIVKDLDFCKVKLFTGMELQFCSFINFWKETFKLVYDRIPNIRSLPAEIIRPNIRPRWPNRPNTKDYVKMSKLTEVFPSNQMQMNLLDSIWRNFPSNQMQKN